MVHNQAAQQLRVMYFKFLYMILFSMYVILIGCASAFNGTIQVTRSPAMNNSSDSSNTTSSSEETTITNSSEATESTTTNTDTESTSSSSTTEPSSAASNEMGNMEMTLNSSSSQDELNREEVTAYSTAVDSGYSSFNASSLDIFSSDSDDIYEYLLNETLSGISSEYQQV